MQWITEAQAIAIHDVAINKYGGKRGFNNRPMLSSGLSRAENAFAYGAYDDVFDLTAEYAYGLVKGHAFSDGNKRTAVFVSDV